MMILSSQGPIVVVNEERARRNIAAMADKARRYTAAMREPSQGDILRFVPAHAFLISGQENRACDETGRSLQVQ